MKIVGIDIDGVLAAVHKKIDREWELAGLTCRHASDVTDFDYMKCVGKEAKKIAYEVFARPKLYDNMNADHNAMRVLNNLRKKYRVVCVSAPFVEHAESKWRFAERCGFRTGDIYLCHDKHLLRLDALVDDKAETLIEPPFMGVLFDQPWNRWLPHPRRARTWDEVEKYLDVNLLS